MELPNDKLNDLHDKDELPKYIYRILINENINQYSECNRKYRPKAIELLDDEPIDETELNDLIKCLSGYEQKLLVVVSSCGNLSELQRKYGIDRRTIYNDIQKIRTKIKSKLHEHLD
jgi:DNA-directed RNA polymerase specialized sigma24 family protein